MLDSRTSTRTYLASLLVAATATAAAQPSDLAGIRIDNFGRVNANYYRGAQPNGRDYADLAALGVKTLVNLTSDDSDDADADEHARCTSRPEVPADSDDDA